MSAASRNSLIRARLAQLMLQRSKGFTLIELLVVIVIVGVLTAVAVPTFLQQIRRSRTAEAQSALSIVATASEVFRSDFSQYPAGYVDISPTNTDYGAKYMDTAFTNSAPCYQDPTQTATAATAASLTDQGAVWSTTSNNGGDSANCKAYITRSGNSLICQIGQGVETANVIGSDYYVKDGCNIAK
jgi:type II secretion system protein G